MRAAISWLLPSDGIFRRASDSLQYFLTCQGQRVVLRGVDVTLPPSERYLTWVHDPDPPPTRCHGDLTSSAPPGNRDNQENTPTQDASRQLPRRLRPHRCREKQPGSSTNENSAFRAADPATRPGSAPIEIHLSRMLIQPGTSGSSSLPQWRILRPSCTHSIHGIPDFGPIKIRNADLTRTTLNSVLYINRPSPASSRIQPTDFVETPSPDLASPHLLFSYLIETPYLDRPMGS